MSARFSDFLTSPSTMLTVYFYFCPLANFNESWPLPPPNYRRILWMAPCSMQVPHDLVFFLCGLYLTVPQWDQKNYEVCSIKHFRRLSCHKILHIWVFILRQTDGFELLKIFCEIVWIIQKLTCNFKNYLASLWERCVGENNQFESNLCC